MHVKFVLMCTEMCQILRSSCPFSGFRVSDVNGMFSMFMMPSVRLGFVCEVFGQLQLAPLIHICLTRRRSFYFESGAVSTAEHSDVLSWTACPQIECPEKRPSKSVRTTRKTCLLLSSRRFWTFALLSNDWAARLSHSVSHLNQNHDFNCPARYFRVNLSSMFARLASWSHKLKWFVVHAQSRDKARSARASCSALMEPISACCHVNMLLSIYSYWCIGSDVGARPGQWNVSTCCPQVVQLWTAVTSSHCWNRQMHSSGLMLIFYWIEPI